MKITTAAELQALINQLRNHAVVARGRGDEGSAAKIEEAIARHETTLATMTADAEAPPPPDTDRDGTELPRGSAVHTKQAQGGKVSVAIHRYIGAHATACRTSGVKPTTDLIPADRPVNCQRCLASAITSPPDEGPPPEPGEGVEDYVDPVEEKARQDSRREARDAMKGQRTPLVDYAPVGVDPPPPIPAGPPRVSGRSLTAGELVAMLLAGRVDASLPIRASGRFHSDATLGAMVSMDGAVVIMAVD